MTPWRIRLVVAVGRWPGRTAPAAARRAWYDRAMAASAAAGRSALEIAAVSAVWLVLGATLAHLMR